LGPLCFFLCFFWSLASMISDLTTHK
jgi:hypothetical protein